MKSTTTMLRLVAVCAITACTAAAHGACSVTYWTTYRGTDVFRSADGSAYFYRTSKVAIDADGAPNAYHPDDKGLDFLKNAGYPKSSWWKDVLVPDAADPSRALIRADGPFAGYFISKTALAATGVADTKPGKFVDATATPYIVFPQVWAKVAGSGWMGDFAYARTADENRSSPAIVADQGGGKDAKLGEISIKLAELLGAGAASPRTGPSNKNMGELIYAVFPKSRMTPAWPLALEQIKQRADELLAKAGGWPAAECLRK
jgi:hypothetical protein